MLTFLAIAIMLAFFTHPSMASFDTAVAGLDWRTDQNGTTLVDYTISTTFKGTTVTYKIGTVEVKSDAVSGHTEWKMTNLDLWPKVKDFLEETIKRTMAQHDL